MKKKIAVAVWQKIQPLIDKHKNLFSALKTDKFAFHFLDKEGDTGFFFTCAFQDPNGHFFINYFPRSKSINIEHKETVVLEQLVAHINSWANILQTYLDTPTIYDDPILKSYENEFFNEFGINEEDADINPFDFKRQLYLDQYIATIKLLIEEHKNIEQSEEKINQLDEIINDCDNLQGEITVISKNQAIRKLANIWAKARKFSLKLIKEIFAEFKKEGISWMTKKCLTTPKIC